jgi:uncharacterized protein DUF6325
MGPLQYMVVAFEPQHFKTEVMPELRYLTGKGTIRIVDVLLVAQGEDGVVTSHELSEVLPEEDTRFFAGQLEDAADWFTQDDIDVVGTTLSAGSSIALLLFEHVWATRLDDAVHDVNARLLANGSDPSAIVAEIEHLLVLGSGSELSQGSTR